MSRDATELYTYRRECPECGNVDKFTENEILKTHHCQRCYYEYEPLLEEGLVEME